MEFSESNTPLPAGAPGAVPLFQLATGAEATIETLHTPTDDDARQVLLRLIELGFLPGEHVRVVAKGRGGREPIAVRLGGQSTFALRQREAALVEVRTHAASGA
ncbi:ferrous iron transport protein A [Ottowia sp. GY511]|uniref:Ferrous iron transport protein A n=1 Tax=Ottowia flava TaxID=2675430 RepID=A0ABW4KS85_9BURK|nr:FeoA family protein [Ottowia sp. GY511]TXK33526.1 ferrous iron transport protein A [Ottowia sp. GY511]